MLRSFVLAWLVPQLVQRRLWPPACRASLCTRWMSICVCFSPSGRRSFPMWIGAATSSTRTTTGGGTWRPTGSGCGIERRLASHGRMRPVTSGRLSGRLNRRLLVRASAAPLVDVRSPEASLATSWTSPTAASGAEASGHWCGLVEPPGMRIASELGRTLPASRSLLQHTFCLLTFLSANWRGFQRLGRQSGGREGFGFNNKRGGCCASIGPQPRPP